MLHISSRDETFLKLNSVMTLRHSRKRDKIYLKKLFYLRNFLNVLQSYRAYLSWKLRKRLKNAVDWHHQVIAWKQATIDWNPILYLPDIETIVIFRFYQCQLTICHFIKSPRLLFFDIVAADKVVQIFSGRETLRRSLLTVCESVDNESVDCETFRSLLTKFSFNLLVSGQMLVNWFAQSMVSIASKMTIALNENDQSTLALQYCKNLLKAGVIKPLDASSIGTEEFKVSEASRLLNMLCIKTIISCFSFSRTRCINGCTRK